MARGTTARDVQKKLKNTTQEGVRILVLELVNGLREATPKDTGFASSNWIASIGKFPRGTVGTREKIDRQASRSAAATVRRTYKLGKRVNVVNNTDYIGKLNDGSSTQAPRAFVQRAIADAIAAAEARISD